MTRHFRGVVTHTTTRDDDDDDDDERANAMKVHIKPRLQQEKWSLYWKTSMSTRTFALDEFDLEVKHDETTAKEVRTRENFGMRSAMTFHVRR